KERMVAGAALERDGVVAFRGVDAQRLLKEEFGIDCSLSSTYRLLHRIKLSWLVPRPRHPEADAIAQAEFFATLGLHSRCPPEKGVNDQRPGKNVIDFSGRSSAKQHVSFVRWNHSPGWSTPPSSWRQEASGDTRLTPPYRRDCYISAELRYA